MEQKNLYPDLGSVSSSVPVPSAPGVDYESVCLKVYSDDLIMFRDRYRKKVLKCGKVRKMFGRGTDICGVVSLILSPTSIVPISTGIGIPVGAMILGLSGVVSLFGVVFRSFSW